MRTVNIKKAYTTSLVLYMYHLWHQYEKKKKKKKKNVTFLFNSTMFVAYRPRVHRNDNCLIGASKY